MRARVRGCASRVPRVCPAQRSAGVTGCAHVLSSQGGIAEKTLGPSRDSQPCLPRTAGQQVTGSFSALTARWPGGLMQGARPCFGASAFSHRSMWGGAGGPGNGVQARAHRLVRRDSDRVWGIAGTGRASCPGPGCRLTPCSFPGALAKTSISMDASRAPERGWPWPAGCPAWEANGPGHGPGHGPDPGLCRVLRARHGTSHPTSPNLRVSNRRWGGGGNPRPR